MIESLTLKILPCRTTGEPDRLGNFRGIAIAHMSLEDVLFVLGGNHAYA
jgi:hypothetical protein